MIGITEYQSLIQVWNLGIFKESSYAVMYQSLIQVWNMNSQIQKRLAETLSINLLYRYGTFREGCSQLYSRVRINLLYRYGTFHLKPIPVPVRRVSISYIGMEQIKVELPVAVWSKTVSISYIGMELKTFASEGHTNFTIQYQSLIQVWNLRRRSLKLLKRLVSISYIGMEQKKEGQSR